MPAMKSLDLPSGFPHSQNVACHETLLIYMKQIHRVNRKDFQLLLTVAFLCAFLLATGFAQAQDSPAAQTAPIDPEISALSAEVRDKGWIVYSAQSGQSDWDLFLMRPNGSARKNITRTRELNEGGARFSPDGSRLLYYRMPKGEVLDNNKYGTYELVIAGAVDSLVAAGLISNARSRSVRACV